MKALERRVSRLEVVSRAREEALVSPETLLKMAAVNDAESARVREKLLADGPHVPAGDRAAVDSEAHRILRQKLLGSEGSLGAESARA
jgi:hypothetical protein